jgi:dolichol-phosphate mannosyltransferase
VPFADIPSEGYSFLIELLARLSDVGASVEEVPITYIDRRAGKSKLSGNVVYEALVRTTRVGLGRLSGARRRAAREAMAR